MIYYAKYAIPILLSRCTRKENIVKEVVITEPTCLIEVDDQIDQIHEVCQQLNANGDSPAPNYSASLLDQNQPLFS